MEQEEQELIRIRKEMTGREGGERKREGELGRIIERIHEANRGMRIGAWRLALERG
jgi:hypothetical protein